MTMIVRTDRSRVEQAQRCLRSRYLGYHEGPSGLGITSSRKPIALAVGGSVHKGLATLLMLASAPGWTSDDSQMRLTENLAVREALDDFEAFDAGRLELDLAETDAQDLTAIDEGERERVRSAVDEWTFNEQKSLVEGMVRAYARRRLRPLLEQYEVLEVEREGEWRLASVEVCDKCGRRFGNHQPGDCPNCWQGEDYELWFMSRPDALLRDRQSNDFYIQSFKTGASWDLRKGKDAEHDAQGLSEGVEIEKRFSLWWHALHDEPKPADVKEFVERIVNDKTIEAYHKKLGHLNKATIEYLRAAPAPPRILGIRYEFLWKGERRRDKDLTARFGVDMRSQSSHLIRGYHSPGMTDADGAWNWSWEYLKEGGETSKLYWKTWRGTAVWEHMPVAEWIDKLDATVQTAGEEGREMGWSGPAQATGFTAAHPLDLVFHPPLIVYRNEDDLRDWIEQTEHAEVRIAENVAAVRAAADEGEKRSLLNRHFPQSRRECVYPSPCQFDKICYGGETIREAPLASGLYTIRVPNHPQEVESGDHGQKPGL